MAEEKKVVTLDDFEQRLMVSGLMDFRNDLLRDEKPTEDINDLILKVIDAPTKKEKRRADREARYSQREVAEIRGIAPAAICKKIAKLKKLLYGG